MSGFRDGDFMLWNLGPGRTGCLDGVYGANSNETYLHNCIGNANQHFYKDGTYLRQRDSGKCLYLPALAGDNRIKMYDCTNNDRYQWTYNENDMTIKSTAYGGRCMDSRDAQTNRPEGNACDPSRDYQKWIYYDDKLNCDKYGMDLRQCTGTAVNNKLQELWSKYKLNAGEKTHPMVQAYKAAMEKRGIIDGDRNLCDAVFGKCLEYGLDDSGNGVGEKRCTLDNTNLYDTCKILQIPTASCSKVKKDDLVQKCLNSGLILTGAVPTAVCNENDYNKLIADCSQYGLTTSQCTTTALADKKIEKANADLKASQDKALAEAAAASASRYESTLSYVKSLDSSGKIPDVSSVGSQYVAIPTTTEETIQSSSIVQIVIVLILVLILCSSSFSLVMF